MHRGHMKGWVHIFLANTNCNSAHTKIEAKRLRAITFAIAKLKER